MRVILKTRCGCTRIICLTGCPPNVRVPMLRRVNALRHSPGDIVDTPWNNPDYVYPIDDRLFTTTGQRDEDTGLMLYEED